MRVAGRAVVRRAPAYDLTYSAGPGGEHYLDVEGEGKNPICDHDRALGRRHGLSDRLIETLTGPPHPCDH